MKNKITLLSWIIAISAAIGISYLIFKPVSLVGTTLITQKNIELKNQVTLKYFPSEKRNLGQMLLEKSFLKYEILKRNGVVIGKKEILDEEARIDRQTQRPEFLLEIKQLFNGNIEEYRKVFVLPILVDRQIYDYFSNSENIHQKPLNYALQIIQSINDNPSLDLKQLSQDKKLEFKLRTIKPFINEAELLGIPEDNRKFAKIPDVFKSNPEYEMWRDILLQLSEGQVYGKPVNVEDRLFMVKLIKKKLLSLRELPNIAEKNDYYQFEAEFIILQKISFEEWFNEEAKSVPKFSQETKL